MLPCYWIYARVGEELLARGSPDPLYARWIAMYGGEEFQAVVDAVLELTDRVGAAASPRELALMREHVIVTSRYEWMFWDAGWRRETWPVLHAGQRASSRSGISRCSTDDTSPTTIAPQKAAQNPSTTNGSRSSLGEPPDEQEQQGVHHEPDQPERQDVERRSRAVLTTGFTSRSTTTKIAATPTSSAISGPGAAAGDVDPGDEDARHPQRGRDDRDPDDARTSVPS